MKYILIIVAFVFSITLFSCTGNPQVPVRQQPKAMLCHVRGVPNACYIFTPKTIEYTVYNNVIIYTLVDDEGQETKVFGMDCLIMPREAIGDGACIE